MKKYSILFLFLMSILGVLVLGETKTSAQIIFNGVQTPLNEAPGINVISNGQKFPEITGETSFRLQLFSANYYTSGTSYEPFGQYGNAENIAGSKASKAYVFDTSAVSKGVLVKNGGIYQGNYIDIKFVIDKFEPKIPANEPLVRFFAIDPIDRDTISPSGGIFEEPTPYGDLYLSVGSGINSHNKNKKNTNLAFSLGDQISYHYEFYYAGTTIPVKAEGIWHYNNINGMKTLIVPSTEVNFGDMYTQENTDIYYTTKDGYTGFTSLNINDVNLPTLRMSRKFSDNKFSILTQANKQKMLIMYSTESPIRLAPAQPIVKGSKNSSPSTEKDYKKLQYKISLYTGDNIIANRFDKYSVETEVPNYYDIDLTNLSIVDAVSGKVLDSNVYSANLDTTNKSKLIVAFNNPKSNDFNGKSFYINVSAKTNNNFSFNPNKYGYINSDSNENNGYMNFELATSTKVKYSYTNENIVNKELTSKKIDEESIAKVKYQGIPTGQAKTGLKLVKGKKVKDTYPNASDLLQSNYSNLIDTNNISLDTPVTAAYNGTVPDTSGLTAGTKVNVPIKLTSKQGVTKDVIAEIEIKDDTSPVVPTYDIIVEFRWQFNSSTNVPIKTCVLEKFEGGTPVDLTKEPKVTATIESLANSNPPYRIKSRPTEQFVMPNKNTTIVYQVEPIESTPTYDITVEFRWQFNSSISVPIETCVLENFEGGTLVNLTKEPKVTATIESLAKSDPPFRIKSRPTEQFVMPNKNTTVVYQVEPIKSILKVEFRNESNQLMSSVEIGDLYPDDYVDLTKVQKVTDELDKYTENNGYTIISRPIEQFTMPTSDKTVSYQLKGNLYIASYPETFDFGKIETKVSDIEVKQAVNIAKEKPLKIIDNRANKSGGWTLNLKSVKEFTSGESEIPKAMVYRTSSKDNFILSGDANIAYRSSSGGDFNLSDTWNDNGPGLGIKLKASDIKKAGVYTSEIEWELVAGAP